MGDASVAAVPRSPPGRHSPYIPHVRATPWLRICRVRSAARDVPFGRVERVGGGMRN